MERREHPPAGRERRIKFHGPREGLDGLRRLPQESVAMPAFLEEPRVGWMRIFQLFECRECLRHALQMTQGDGVHVQEIAMPRKLPEQALRARSGFLKAVLFDLLLQAAQLRVGNRRAGRMGWLADLLHAGMMRYRAPQRKRAGGLARRPAFHRPAVSARRTGS